MAPVDWSKIIPRTPPSDSTQYGMISLSLFLGAVSGPYMILVEGNTWKVEELTFHYPSLLELRTTEGPMLTFRVISVDSEPGQPGIGELLMTVDVVTEETVGALLRGH